MRPGALLCFFSTAVAASNVNPRFGEEIRALEARALTTLYTTSTIYSTSKKTTTSCILSLGSKSCLLATTKTVTTTVPVKTTVVPYTTKSVTSTTSSVKTTTSSAKTTSTSSVITSQSTKPVTSSSASSSSKLPASSSSVVPVTNIASSTTLSSSATSSSAASSSGSTTAQPVPTCGFVGYDNGTTNLGFYTDASSVTYAGCNALCTSNTACLSFAYATSGTPACILYGYIVEGYDTASAGSPYTFFDRGGVCPNVTTTSTSTSSTAPATPSFTAGLQYCPSGEVTYNVSAPVAGYTGCNSTYTYSTCAAGVDGTAFCNLCGACNNATACTSTSQCQTTLGAGYACVSNSACVTGGTPVCLYMLAGGDAYGCYGSHSS